MTTRHSGYVVVLAEDLRDDDGEATLNALRMVKGVLSVEPVPAQHSGAFIVEERMRSALRKELYDLAVRI